VNVVVEIGPHSALAAPLKAIRTSLGYSPERLVYLSALKRNTDSVESLLKLAGSLFLSGWPLDISTINADETIYQNETGSDRIQYSHGSFIEDLPTYQWTYDEDLLWTESRLSTDIRFRSYPHHDLLGSRLPGTSNGAPAWRNLLSLDHVPWLRDHRVGDDIVFPAAGYVCLAVEAVTQICGSTVTAVNDAYTLRDVNITSAMVLKEGLSTELMFDLWTVPGQPATYQFSVSTFSQGTWTQHATGSVLVDSKSTNGEFSLTRTSLQMLTFKQINCCGLVTGMSAAAVVSTRTAMIAVGMLPWTKSDWSMDQVSRRFPISVLALIIIKRLRRFRGVQPTG
jgi:acyl transferase domain-containing protein